MPITRRSLMLTAGAVAAASLVRAQAPAPRLKAAIIGHTGRGEYGHAMELVFKDRSNIDTVAVADPVESGRAKAVQRCGAARQYADWREMLDKEKPQIVSIAPRQTSLRKEMLLGAIAAGAHIVCEKPFVQTPADGDAVLVAAAKANLRIAVMHQMRLAPAVVHLKKKADDGALGELLEMRAFGKQDRRAGGEDLVVLGGHLFDLMRLFAGNPQWCAARVLTQGRDATEADLKKAGEDVGLVLGDEIDAQFAFDNGVLGTFTSRARLAGQAGYWGIELIGSKASARILADIWPRVFFKPTTAWTDAGRADEWKPFADDPAAAAPAPLRSNALANARVADDLLAAIQESRPPACSGDNAARAIEMVWSVWRAALAGQRLRFPLTPRTGWPDRAM